MTKDLSEYMKSKIDDMRILWNETQTINCNSLKLYRIIDELERKVSKFRNDLDRFSKMKLDKKVEMELYFHLETVEIIQNILDDYERE